jgi:hypothetical protein
VLPLDAPLLADLAFPLFVRTDASSWKLGGRVGRVETPADLEAEAAALRRALGWDAVILAREWLDLAPAGEGVYGPIPQEVRTWIVDGVPFAWAFHYLNVLKSPRGFPPSADDLALLADYAARVGRAFSSRLVAADFARLAPPTTGRTPGVGATTTPGWSFIEAGPGSCAGTDHEAVFKAVARRLRGEEPDLEGDAVGGRLG